MERTTRFELATLALARRCSTPEPRPLDDGVMVRVEGLEPPCRKTLDPKSSASANSATRAEKMVSHEGLEPSTP
jgi:hypothetical protein